VNNRVNNYSINIHLSSIDIAIKYKDAISDALKEKIIGTDLEEQYSDYKVFIVYSTGGQKYQNPTSLNYGMKEDKVISEFKKANHAIIIVVDNLQTGFDDCFFYCFEIFIDSRNYYNFISYIK
jgi:type I site-specific restriction-modification system R (restriction) subunit